MSKPVQVAAILATICVANSSQPSDAQDSAGFGVPVLSPSAQGSGTYAISSLGLGKDENALETRFVDWQDNRICAVTVDEHFAPRCVVFDDTCVDFDQSTPRPYPIQMLYRVHDSVASAYHLNREEGRDIVESEYGFPLRRVLNSENVLEESFDARVQRRHIKFRTGDFYVWYRSPYERKFFRYPISAVMAKLNGKAVQWYTNMQTGTTGLGRINHPAAWHREWRKLSDGLNEKARDSDSERPSTTAVDQESLLSLKQLAKGTLIDSLFDDWAEDFRKLYDLAFLRCAAERKKQLTPQEVKDRGDLVLVLMSKTITSLDKDICDGDSFFLDPHVRGLVLEQLFRRDDELPMTSAHRIAEVIEDLRRRDGILTFSLMSMYAELGFSPCLANHEILRRCLNGTLEDHLAAAVLARWRWPTEVHHADAVVEFLSESHYSPDRWHAIETLILMDELDRIPEDLLNTWFKKIVVSSKHRKRRVSYLMQNKAGREFLLEKYAISDADQALRNTIRNLLDNEIKAAHEFEDYRFMSKQECDEISKRLGLDQMARGLLLPPE